MDFAHSLLSNANPSVIPDEAMRANGEQGSGTLRGAAPTCLTRSRIASAFGLGFRDDGIIYFFGQIGLARARSSG
jgi:hypothetical protein